MMFIWFRIRNVSECWTDLFHSGRSVWTYTLWIWQIHFSKVASPYLHKYYYTSVVDFSFLYLLSTTAAQKIIKIKTRCVLNNALSWYIVKWIATTYSFGIRKKFVILMKSSVWNVKYNLHSFIHSFMHLLVIHEMYVK